MILATLANRQIEAAQRFSIFRADSTEAVRYFQIRSIETRSRKSKNLFRVYPLRARPHHSKAGRLVR
jgi:hypothetical protein